MERMAEIVPETNDQSLQHFLSNSPWDEQPIIDQVGKTANQYLGGTKQTALVIDETGISKKGKMSVGVARQYNGRLGKVDNCQVAVKAALSRGAHVMVVDTRLFFTKDSIADTQHLDKAQVPLDKRVHKTKLQLAIECVKSARARGLRFEYVSADGLYGNSQAFVRELTDMGEIFCVDVHLNQHIYLDDPQPYLSDTGKTLKTDVNACWVQTWAYQQPNSAWKAVTIRHSTRGKLRVEVLHQRVWLWDKKEAKARHWHLLVRREIGRTDHYHYAISNADASIQTHELAKMQAQRFWIERAFEDGKSYVGMAQYQVRGWRAWHHHMSLVMMAMLFMLKIRLLYLTQVPLLSCNDIVQLLSCLLPKIDLTLDEVISQMDRRHVKRQASIDSAVRNQTLTDENGVRSNVTK